jgi:hypothetical protein
MKVEFLSYVANIIPINIRVIRERRKGEKRREAPVTFEVYLGHSPGLSIKLVNELSC